MKLVLQTSIFILFTVFVSNAQANVSCSVDPSTPTINATIALQGGNITAGEDLPNGTILFRQYFKPSRTSIALCTSTVIPWNLFRSMFYTVNPKPLSSWNSGPWANKVYETGVPGIGVVAWMSNDIAPFNKQTGTHSGSSQSVITKSDFDIAFVKTGPISPGTIRGQDLPTVAYEVLGSSGTPARIININFNGAINVVAKTCTTPNPVIQMGAWNKDQQFKGVGSTSDWVNATINLTNCPRFHGIMDAGQSNYGSDSPTDPGGVGTPVANNLGLVLQPNTSIIDNTKGIIALQDQTGAASGVGIQVAYNNNATPQFATFNSEKKFAMTNSSNTTVSLPLFARYYQTQTVVEPGVANATMTYTINYY
ncbi:fimbrial protein [Enterobacter asburiae]|uniref:fimbrial protein n=1 Tax=Enterobacter asburiae TaxID=61645 RepID=UPI001BE104E4|nr:fimbrial protein [Enterobacter asburiae]MBT2048484.1 type 1 fimbrial protein [Enterobacter asburiae]